MRLTAHQPTYIPWLGLLAKMNSADLYVHLDTVPSSHNSFENRQLIKTQNGATWLTVPTHRGKDVLLRDVTIANDQPWARKHWRSIELAYSQAPHYERYSRGLRELLLFKWTNLSQLGLATLMFFAEVFGIKTKVVIASSHEFVGAKSGLILDMTKKLGADRFLFGSSGPDYVDAPLFEREGVQVAFQSYEHPTYPQLHGLFIPNMGCLDLLMNVGGERGLEVIMKGHSESL